jgi:hypothetical protein
MAVVSVHDLTLAALIVMALYMVGDQLKQYRRCVANVTELMWMEERVAMEALIGFKGNMNAKDASGRNAVMLAALLRKPQLLQWLLGNTSISVGACNRADKQKSALMYACDKLGAASGDGITKLKAGVDAQSAECAAIILETCTTELLNLRASVSEGSGDTALHIACYHDLDAVVARLLQRPDIDTGVRNCQGRLAVDMTTSDSIRHQVMQWLMLRLSCVCDVYRYLSRLSGGLCCGCIYGRAD